MGYPLRIARAAVRPQHTRGQMNGTESRYAEHLQLRKLCGEIAEFWFEGIRLKIGEGALYTPDFLVQLPDGMIECHECKGHWEEASKVRIKVASSLYPFRFVAVYAIPKRDGGGWKVEEF